MRKHLSTQFDADLDFISSRVVEMGKMVESQLANAMQALEKLDLQLAEQVIANEKKIDAIEIELDAECNHIIARRQPIARDLRLVMATAKTITNLERVGDEAEKIATCTKHIVQSDFANHINYLEIKHAGEMANALLHRAIEAFSQLDIYAARVILQDDSALDEIFRAFVRKLISYVTEEPRIISMALDYLFIAKAIERIGDHATNIAEFTIYIVEGTDVRHAKLSIT